MASPVFLHGILRSPHLITAVQLEYETALSMYSIGALDRALQLLSALPNLRALTIEGRVARALFGDGSDEPGSDESYRMKALVYVAPRVDELTLSGMMPAEMSRFLRLWPTNLRRLYLVSVEDDPPVESEWDPPHLNHILINIAGSVSELPRLEYLAIESGPNNASSDQVPFTDRDLIFALLQPPPLKSLSLSYDIHFTAAFTLIAAFHSTLEHLTITTRSVDPIYETEPQTTPTKLVLPHLKTLVLSNHAGDIGGNALRVLLAHFDLSPLTRLTILDDINDLSFQPSGHLNTLDSAIPSLRILTLDSPAVDISLDEYRMIRSFHAKHGLPPPAHSLFDQERLLTASEDGDLDELCDEVDAVLAFGQRQAEWSRTLGDVMGGLALVKALKPLSELRKDWRD